MAQVSGNLVVMGIPPTRPETGYGYIERGGVCERSLGISAFEVRRFTEKPALRLARRYVASRRYFWNAGMFFWRVSTFLNALKQFLPGTHDALIELKQFIGRSQYPRQLRRTYARLENISVDYAVMEPATQMKDAFHVAVIPAKVGWSDIGSWAAVYELLAQKPGANVSNGPFHVLDASGNYFWSPKKFVAAIGVHDLVLVETDDATLLCRRDHSQDVGKIVKWLEENRRRELL
jgi:mannose-1-phosphate guanylyltransferase